MENMGSEQVVDLIPVSLYGIVSKGLVDIILGTDKTDRIPTALAKSILYLWQRDHLENEVGIKKLLEAATLIEPEKTVAFFREVGLQEIVVALKETYL